MPTAKPRIFVTLDPELADAIRRIGLGSKMSQSAFIAEILNGQRHALLSLADAMDKARAIQGPLSGALAAVLGRSESDLDGMSDEAMSKLDELHLVLDQAIEEQGAEPPARSSEGGRRAGGSALSDPIQPPLINKGARNGRQSKGESK